MSGIISGNMVGGAAPLRTLILEDSDGVQLTGVVVGSEVVFTADASTDIRAGKVAATDAGVVTGSVTIPNYETNQGWRFVTPGDMFQIPTLGEDWYDYTFLQCIITVFNTTIEDSVYAEYVVIDHVLYETKGTVQTSVITKNTETSSIDFNITNDTDNMYLIRYSTYKEVV